MKKSIMLWKDDQCNTHQSKIAFNMADVVMVEESAVFENCTVVTTVYSSFVLNEKFDNLYQEWITYKDKEKIGIE